MTVDRPNHHPSDEPVNWVEYDDGIKLFVYRTTDGLTRVYLENGQESRQMWIQPRSGESNVVG